LNAAAKIIQDMVAEIAAMFATMALGKLIGAAQKGIDRFKVECTHCDLKGPGAEEAKAPAETKAEPAKENASGKEKPPQEAARERLDKLN
ncbi:hypothetical protein, partial [Acinetobacter baumannii]|uniref:hypothetical protein n=1 Tax=Acinetobacter baumannii TaxID=470 RepID=UPI001BB46994